MRCFVYKNIFWSNNNFDYLSLKNYNLPLYIKYYKKNYIKYKINIFYIIKNKKELQWFI